ncbi:MAG TPA: helix-turn-helix domain-containing protein [Patescibacteria group bacterium]|nr:helix-turn-helix domain-containing protein [Patescibacteria group bacterium]
METLFNINQAAYILKVHPLTVRRYIKEGRLKAVRVGGNVRIKESSLQEFNKDFTPVVREKSPFKTQKLTKIFTQDDPLLRLKGRGASVNFTSENKK